MPEASASSSPSPLPDGSAVLFDLDGTLTRPVFDFDVIRREIGLPTQPKTPVLEAMEKMADDERQRAEEILHRHEHEAAETSELWDDTLDVLAAVRNSGRPVGLITRNSKRSADTVIAKHGLQVDLVRTREDGVFKPSPKPVLAMCQRLGVEPEDTWLVGDYLFDLQSGNAAGATTVLMVGDAEVPSFADQADHVIRRLRELLQLLAITL